MRARVECSCGWQRELSEFYAGKRIRCPECASVLDVPGDSVPGLYNSPLPRRAKPSTASSRRGCWVGSSCCAPRKSCGGLWIIIVFVVLVNGARLWHHTHYGEEAYNEVPNEQIERDEVRRYQYEARPDLPDMPQPPYHTEPRQESPAKPEPADEPADPDEDEF